MTDTMTTKQISIDNTGNDDPIISGTDDDSVVDSDVDSVVSDDDIMGGEGEGDDDNDDDVPDDNSIVGDDDDDMQGDEVLTVPKKEVSKLPTQTDIDDISGVSVEDVLQPEEPSVVEHLTMKDDSESDSDSDEYDDSYLQKFSDDQKKSLIEEHHPEIVYHNNREIEQLSKCVKNKDGIPCDPLHMTNPFLSKFEYTRILGMRTKQLNNGSKPFIKVPEGIIDGYLIAEREVREKKLPFIIKRPIPNGGCEYWKLQDLELLI